jgi:ubiquinone/menaquinone biosynthesis C-methylase UbiE
VLECGCGTGLYTAVLARHANHVTATDCSDEMLGAAARNLQGLAHVTFGKARCEELPYPDGRFDTVVMINLIHVIEQPGQALGEAYRVLKPGGRLIVASYTSFGMGLIEKLKLFLRYLRAFGRPPRHMRRSLSPDDLRMLAEGRSFTVEQAALIRNRVNAVYLTARK